MDTKLTLKLDAETIQKVKIYAKKNHQSLSGLVESYFENLTHEVREKAAPYSPIVRQLKGKVKLDKAFDTKEDYAGYLGKKYK
ncbi:MAG TPA: DUF6364 family protein [bacterium]|jgi:hypothetical protein|nr:DUF6364 family protein [bacterium]